jgi:hypothetical protein
MTNSGYSQSKNFAPEVAQFLRSVSQAAMVEYSAEGFQELRMDEGSSGNEPIDESAQRSVGKVIWGQFLFDRTAYRVSGKNVGQLIPSSDIKVVDEVSEFRFDGTNTRYLLGKNSRKLMADSPPSLIGMIDIGMALGDRLAQFLTSKQNLSVESLISETPWDFFPDACELRMKSNWPNSENAYNEISFFLSRDHGYLPEKIRRTLVVNGQKYVKAELKVVSFHRTNEGIFIPAEFVETHSNAPVCIRAKLDTSSIKVYSTSDPKKFRFDDINDWESPLNDRRTSTIVAKNNELRAERLRSESAAPTEDPGDPWLATKALILLGVLAGVFVMWKRGFKAMLLFVLVGFIGCDSNKTNSFGMDENPLLEFSVKQGQEFKISCDPPLTQNHEVRVKNVSGKELQVLEIVTSCGCATATLEDRELATNEESKLLLTLSAPGIAEGPKIVSVKICFSMDGLRREKLLELATIADTDWRPSQPELVFSGEIGGVGIAEIHCIHNPGSIVRIGQSCAKLTDTVPAEDGTTFRFELPLEFAGKAVVGEIVIQAPGLRPSRLVVPCVVNTSSCLIWDKRVLQLFNGEVGSVSSELPDDIEVLGIDSPSIAECQFAVEKIDTARRKVVLCGKGISPGIGQTTIKLIRGQVEFVESLVTIVGN